MPLEDSPSVETVAHGIPAPQPPGMTPGRRRLWAAAGILGLVLIALVIANLGRGNNLATLTGTGSVSGQVVDENNRPVQAEVILIGQKNAIPTGPDGRFELKNVPSGLQSLVVGYQGTAREVPFNAVVGQIVDIGQIQVVATQVPGE
jgi:hypothetical protein